ncbi:DUF968 domain-containing protein [Rosenbergiella epipactidis]|uniref:DUF968 domain-containing protein n=1 Tax=Rosenbergiella epipactidis TaxID=1544694 RepID=UPI001F4D757A|nr:DUF968 domain-containing protein [Rosenbergiella epipactidis]
MRAILTPDVAPLTGTVIFKPGNELLSLFRSGKVLVSNVPENLRDTPSGRLSDSVQPLIDNPSIIDFMCQDEVIAAAGGSEVLRDHVRRFHCCQFESEEYHHKHYTTLKSGTGYVSLCYTHDNNFHDVHIPQPLQDVAKLNTANWVIGRVIYKLSLPEGHQLTLPELCCWAFVKGLVHLLPEGAVRAILKRPPAEVLSGPQKESTILPFDNSGRHIIEEGAEAVKKVLALSVDPESPESFMRRPKRKRWVNEKYTRWVKSQSCACCGQPADDPHHIIGYGQGGMGTKAHDLFVIPLCRKHHDELHADQSKFENKYGTQLELFFRFFDHAIAVGVIG